MDQQSEDGLPQLPEAHQSGESLLLLLAPSSLPPWSQGSRDQEGAVISGTRTLLMGRGTLPGSATSHKSFTSPGLSFPSVKWGYLDLLP